MTLTRTRPVARGVWLNPPFLWEQKKIFLIENVSHVEKSKLDLNQDLCDINRDLCSDRLILKIVKKKLPVVYEF